MSESSSEDIPASEIRKRLRDEPFYVQRLGKVAMNINFISEFNFLIEQGRSPEAIYIAIIQELRDQDIPEPEKWLELFGVPYMYD